MTDKERIEKLLITMKHIDNCLMYLRKMPMPKEARESIDDIKSSIQVVLDANTDQITIDL